MRHVVPTVGRSAPCELINAQTLTAESIARAVRNTHPSNEIDLRAVHFPDEDPLDADVTSRFVLERSILDLAEFTVARRLPLLGDVVGAFGSPDEYDVAVLTNADIALQPYFYDLVTEIFSEGYDAFSINRRTVFERFSGSSVSRLASSHGIAHPGHDCFVMSAQLVPLLEKVDISLGVPGVGTALLWQLALHATRFRTFRDLRATYHVGDDRVWANDSLADYAAHNRKCLAQLVRRLEEKHGVPNVAALPGFATFRTAQTQARRGAGVEVVAASEDIAPIPANIQPRLIFSATAGRTGSGFLANLLTHCPFVEGGHELPPRMNGECARQIAYEGRLGSYSDRLHKADSLRDQLRILPDRWSLADINHMFVKTYADVVLDNFEHSEIAVVVLRRDPVLVARSMFTIDNFGPQAESWLDFIHPPTTPTSSFSLELEEIQDQFDLIFGYLADTERRIQELMAMAPQVFWIETKLEELVTPLGAARLLSELDVAPPEELGSAVGGIVNRKTREKDQLSQRASTRVVRAKLESFLDRHVDRTDLAPFAEWVRQYEPFAGDSGEPHAFAR